MLMNSLKRPALRSLRNWDTKRLGYRVRPTMVPFTFTTFNAHSHFYLFCHTGPLHDFITPLTPSFRPLLMRFQLPYLTFTSIWICSFHYTIRRSTYSSFEVGAGQNTHNPSKSPRSWMSGFDFLLTKMYKVGMTC